MEEEEWKMASKNWSPKKGKTVYVLTRSVLGTMGEGPQEHGVPAAGAKELTVPQQSAAPLEPPPAASSAPADPAPVDPPAEEEEEEEWEGAADPLIDEFGNEWRPGEAGYESAAEQASPPAVEPPEPQRPPPPPPPGPPSRMVCP